MRVTASTQSRPSTSAKKVAPRLTHSMMRAAEPMMARLSSPEIEAGAPAAVTAAPPAASASLWSASLYFWRSAVRRRCHSSKHESITPMA